MTLSALPEVPRPSLATRLVRMGRQDWADMLRAAWHLAQARRVLGRLDPRGFRPGAAADPAPLPCPLAPAQLDRMSRAIGRAALLVPWRADCLVQAEAGRRWIAGLGVAAEIRLGARKGPDGRLDAHAWLLCGGLVVTGGDISRYVPFA
jgi:hypothetical protein